jgi:FAD/FMN-containing dehydrogenase
MSLFDQLAAIVGPDNFSATAGDRHASDWSKLNPCPPEYVIYPRSTAEVSAILALCNEHNQAVVTQGGLTGLSGGATPQANELAMSLEKLSGIIELDADSQCITVKAGTPLQVVQEAAENAGFTLPLDLGARGSCSIGGNIATNAGGNQVIRYGMARALVLGLEAVQANGEVIRAMNKMLTNNAGYDLKHLFIGTEGTLGVITEAVLRIFPGRAHKQTLLCAASSFGNVSALLRLLLAQTRNISAFEVMWQSYVDLALAEVDSLRDPFPQRHPFYVLIEIEGSEDIEALLEKALEENLVDDALVAQTLTQADAFWDIRDAVAHLLPALQGLANFDIGIPIKHMDAFTTRLEQELKQKFPGLSVQIFGHIGDGNLHVFAHRGNDADVPNIFDCVYRIAADYGGAVTAEHGVGMHKVKYLHHSRSDAEIALMRQLKQSMDPNNILNPGRVIPAA